MSVIHHRNIYLLPFSQTKKGRGKLSNLSKVTDHGNVKIGLKLRYSDPRTML